jgi:hypothetical protein
MYFLFFYSKSNFYFLILVNDRSGDLSTFDQSGEFASELHEIQREIDSSNSLSLSRIADLLETKRRLTIYQIYFSISYLIPNCFLIARNQSAFDLIRSRSTPILKDFVGDYDRFRPIYSILPNPLLSIQKVAKQLYPWTIYEYQYNINEKRLWWPRYTLADLIHVSLIGLKPQELALANAEYVSTQVMLQNMDEIVKPKTAANNMSTVLHKKEVRNNLLDFYLRCDIHRIEKNYFILFRHLLVIIFQITYVLNFILPNVFVLNLFAMLGVRRN